MASFYRDTSSFTAERVGGGAGGIANSVGALAGHKSQSARSKQHGLEVKFHPIEHDKLRSLEELVFKLDVTKDSMHYVIVKNIPEFVMFRHIVSDSIDWMERVFPAVPVELIDAPQYTVALKLWITEFLHDGPKLTAEVLYAMLTFFRVSENLGLNRNVNISDRIDLRSRLTANAGIKKMGYLLKFGGDKRSSSRGNWRRRYMVLEDDLKYYESEAAFLSGADPKGVLCLNMFHVLPLVNKNASDTSNLENEFTIYAVPLELKCRASSEVEMDSWINTLNSFRFLS